VAEGEPPGRSATNTDLTIKDLVTATVVYDGQALTVSGTISATVVNQGTDAVNTPFSVSFLEDRNGNQTFDPGVDNVLGSTQVATPVSAGQSLPVAATLSGHVQFSGNVIWGFVDSDNAVLEADESNNLARASGVTTPTPGQFSPAVAWKKDSFTIQPTSKQITMTPVVADLNGDGIPEIIVTTYASTNGVGTSGGVLRALRGNDGFEVWNVTNPNHEVYGFGSLAVGDTDLDRPPEIVAVRNSGGGFNKNQLVAFEHDGSFKWLSATTWR
jgi:hypothetical protein